MPQRPLLLPFYIQYTLKSVMCFIACPDDKSQILCLHFDGFFKMKKKLKLLLCTHTQLIARERNAYSKGTW